MKKLTYCLFLLVSASIQAEDLSPFKATYDLYYKWMHLGSGEYQLSRQENGVYDFTFESKMRFLVYVDERKVHTSFHYHFNEIEPIRYEHLRWGTGRDYQEDMIFSPEKNVITANFLKQTKTVTYSSLIKDGLSVQLQVMLDVQKGVQPLKYHIFEIFGVKEREFIYLDDEKIEIDDKVYHCIQVEVKRPEKDFKTRMWFARELDYFPVQLVHYAEGKKQFSAVLTGYQDKRDKAIEKKK